VNFINLFDLDMADNVWNGQYRDGFNVSDELFFSGTWDPAATATELGFDNDARYGGPIWYMAPRTIRFQARLIF
jgi:hypothetical protein